MEKSDLKKMLEDDFFGEGDPLGGLEDISMDFNEKVQPKKTSEDNNEDNIFELEGDDKDVFDLDGFDFDEGESLLGSDLNLEDFDSELSFDDDKKDSKQNIDFTNDENIFGDVSKDVASILNKSYEQFEETEQTFEIEETAEVEETVELETTDIEIETETYEETEYVDDFVQHEDNNTFTNYVQNDTINIEENYPDIEENKGIEMGKTTLNYNDFSDAMNQEYINVKKLDFPEINNQLSGSKFKVDLFSNIPVTIDVYLGKTTISLKDVHELSKGSVIELDKFYGEPLDLKINGELIATGEVVSIDNKYGIMIKDIVKS